MDEAQAKALNFKAQSDQIAGMMADIAPVIATYYRTLVAQGLPEQFALLMARDFQMTILTIMGLPAKQV